MIDFKKDRLYSALHRKEIEQRIFNYPIFDVYEQQLVHFVNDTKNMVVENNRKGHLHQFVVSVEYNRISIETQKVNEVGTSAMICDFRYYGMEILTKLSQMDAICSVLRKKSETVFKRQLSNFKHSIYDAYFEEKILPKKKFIIEVYMENAHYQAPLKW